MCILSCCITNDFAVRMDVQVVIQHAFPTVLSLGVLAGPGPICPERKVNQVPQPTRVSPLPMPDCINVHLSVFRLGLSARPSGDEHRCLHQTCGDHFIFEPSGSSCAGWAFADRFPNISQASSQGLAEYFGFLIRNAQATSQLAGGQRDKQLEA